jgi:hypothetical protein
VAENCIKIMKDVENRSLLLLFIMNRWSES